MEMSTKAIMKLTGIGFGVLFLIIATLSLTERVPEGKVAVVYTPSAGVKKVLDPGWHPIMPFHKTQQYPTRITIVKDKVTATTKDGKSISSKVSYEMKTDREKVLEIFKELGSQNIEQIQEGYLYQRLFRASREVISEYSVLDIYGTKTTEASARITEKMAEESEGLGFMITNVVLGTPQLDEETESAINERVKSAQELELKKQQLENARVDAEKKEVEAEGEKQKKLIEAQAEKEANELVNQSITPEILQLEEIKARQQWGWITVQGAGGIIVDDKE